MNVKVLYFVKNSPYNCENQEAHQIKHNIGLFSTTLASKAHLLQDNTTKIN